MYRRFCLILTISVILSAAPCRAESEHETLLDPVSGDLCFIFKSPKGAVRFNHDKHKAEMKADSCLPCHKTLTPTKEHTMTRLDQRAAHFFCKGCHKEKGRGPQECHECHKAGKK